MTLNADRMPRKRVRAWPAWRSGIIVAGLALVLSSCEYLRLLQFKNQLKQIERYFHLENTANGLTLTCKQPVLKPDDALLIFADAPTVRLTEHGSEQWRYDFRKRSIRGTSEPANFDFSQVLTFERGQLTALQYTATFPTVFDDRLLRRILHAIGQGALDEQKERLTLHVNLEEIARPTQRRFESAWGRPYTIVPVSTDGSGVTEQRHVYVYTLQTPQISEDTAIPILTLWLVFEPATGAVQRLTAWYKHHSLELSFTDATITGFLEIDL